MAELHVIAPNCREFKMFNSRKNKIGTFIQWDMITVVKMNKLLLNGMSLTNSVVWRKADTKGNILYDSIYVMFKNQAKLKYSV